MDLSLEDLKIIRMSRSKLKGKVISPGILRNLIHVFESVDQAFLHLQKFLDANGSSIATEVEIEKELSKVKNFGAKIITHKSRSYPRILKLIPDYPLVLTYLGNIDLINQKVFGIVGSRNASHMGQSFATKISSELVSYGFVVISGLARGIDTSAHMGAIKSTIAVMAGGIDHIYPQENLNLYQKISDQGLIITENKIGHNPIAIDFRARNRIIAGVALGVCVVEAAKLSGSLVTARFALEYNRDVFAVPGQPLDPRSFGTNSLILDGAYMVNSIEDIIRNLNDINNVLDINKNMVVQESFGKVDLFNINANSYKTVLDILNFNPTSIEMIHNYSRMELRVLHLILLELELTDKVKRYSGNKFALNSLSEFE